MKTKKCRRCKKFISIDNFIKANKNKDGLGSYCKKCKNNIVKQWIKIDYKKDKKKYNDRSRQYSEKCIEAIFNHYGNKCVICRETRKYMLTVDHIDGNGKEHRTMLKTRGSKFYRWIIKNEFPSNFRILCWNCNAALGIKKISEFKLKSDLLEYAKFKTPLLNFLK